MQEIMEGWMTKTRLTTLLTTAAYIVAFVVVPVFNAPQYALADDCSTLDTNIQKNIQDTRNQATNAFSSYSTYLNSSGYDSQSAGQAFDGYVTQFNSRIPTIHTQLVDYAQQGCGSADTFQNYLNQLNERIGILNGLIDTYNTKNKTSLPHVGADTTSYNPKTTSDYDCQKLAAKAQADEAAADSAMGNAGNRIDAWLRDTSENNAASDAMTTAANAITQAKTSLAAMKSAGCNTNPATQAQYNDLQDRIDALMQQVIDLNTKIANSGNSLANQAWNGLLDAVQQVSSCGCGDLTKNDGIINGIFNRAICLTVCTISSGLGVIACYIIGALIDPVFGGNTCTPNADNGSNTSTSPSPGTASAPKTSASSSPGTSKTPSKASSTPTVSAPAATPEAVTPQPTLVR